MASTDEAKDGEASHFVQSNRTGGFDQTTLFDRQRPITAMVVSPSGRYLIYFALGVNRLECVDIQTGARHRLFAFGDWLSVLRQSSIEDQRNRGQSVAPVSKSFSFGNLEIFVSCLVFVERKLVLVDTSTHALHVVDRLPVALFDKTVDFAMPRPLIVECFAGGSPLYSRPGFVDGMCSVARFSHPLCAVFLSSQDGVFVADSLNNRIRKINSCAEVSSIGNGAPKQNDGNFKTNPDDISFHTMSWLGQNPTDQTEHLYFKSGRSIGKLDFESGRVETVFSSASLTGCPLGRCLMTRNDEIMVYRRKNGKCGIVCFELRSNPRVGSLFLSRKYLNPETCGPFEHEEYYNFSGCMVWDPNVKEDGGGLFVAHEGSIDYIARLHPPVLRASPSGAHDQGPLARADLGEEDAHPDHLVQTPAGHEENPGSASDPGRVKSSSPGALP